MFSNVPCARDANVIADDDGAFYAIVTDGTDICPKCDGSNGDAHATIRFGHHKSDSMGIYNEPSHSDI